MEFLNDIDVYRILSLGGIGLGFFLGVFAFRLLSLEQKKKEPRQRILNATYTFMAFSIILVCLGIWGRSIDIKSTPTIDGTDEALERQFYKTKHDLGIDLKVDQFKFGTLSRTQPTDVLKLDLKSNECKLALAMTQPLHKITVKANEINDGGAEEVKIKQSSGLNFERIEVCAGSRPAVVTLTFSVSKEFYKYRAESFFEKTGKKETPIK